MNPRSASILERPIEYLKGVGPQRGALLQSELGIFTCGDLLQHYPYRYIDRTKINRITDISPESQYIQLKGYITDINVIGDKQNKRLVAIFEDQSGAVELVWFRGISYMEKYLQKNVEYLIFGKPNFFRNTVNFPHPEIEALSEQKSPETAARLQAMYPSTEKMKARGLDSKGMAKLLRTLLELLPPHELPEFLPEWLLQGYHLLPRYETYKNLHIPDTEYLIAQAQHRIKFEELFFIQLRILKIKEKHQKTQGFVWGELGAHFNTFFKEHLPFELTDAQKRVIKEIRKDTLNGIQMNRLLQGDVGSGKTVVALMCMLMAADNGFQAALMAPTEILAQQHFNSLSAMLQKMDLRVDILTGSIKGKKRRHLLEELQLGMIDVLVGTHALIEDNVLFKNLGFVVIDEQHRFGVAQRAKLWEKNQLPPHVLVMTATPIPRTLAMTVYGDLDVSVIDELPPGRKAIITAHRFESSRLQVFQFLKEQIAEGRQIYIVYPLIEESETLDLKNLQEGYENIVRVFPMPEYQVSIVHGKMKPAAKDAEMQRFKNGETQIMVATTVIEVGVDVPNASVMLIENAERFGLSQLHQLRGRVGRGAKQSFCILMSDYKLSQEARQRLQTMTETNDGFKIAEVDLKLRGPGDLEGTQQSGIATLRMANLIKDQDILQIAHQAAAEMLALDADLILPQHLPLRQHLTQLRKKQGLQWGKIS
ncbi:MAG: ATP-dependent DNA helicase RecG [Sphingobacteriales bacterium]|nr:ATP-dependent DNA helicase RecG [Sphingobacteriales bacterium]